MQPTKDRSLLRPIPRVLSAVVVVMLALVPQPSHGQVSCTFMSLEWLVADAEVVVRGSVAEVSREKPEEQWVWMTVTLKAHETLKGDVAKSLTFATRTFVSDKRYDEWRDAGQEQLWFLVRNEQFRDKREPDGKEIAARHRFRPYELGWSFIRLGPSVPAERDFVPGPPPIFTMDLEVLEKPQEILKAAKAALAEQGKRKVRSHSILLPRDVAQRSGQSGDVNQLVVPVDDRLETLARGMIKSPGDFLQGKSGSTNLLRREGAKAPAAFQVGREHRDP